MDLETIQAETQQCQNNLHLQTKEYEAKEELGIQNAEWDMATKENEQLRKTQVEMRQQLNILKSRMEEQATLNSTSSVFFSASNFANFSFISSPSSKTITVSCWLLEFNFWNGNLICSAYLAPTT